MMTPDKVLEALSNVQEPDLGKDIVTLNMVKDIVIDGNLGMPFLKDWVVTMDLSQGHVWLKRSAVAVPAGMGTPPPVKPMG